MRKIMALTILTFLMVVPAVQAQVWGGWHGPGNQWAAQRMENRGAALERRGQRLENMGYMRQGARLERRGEMMQRRAERFEHWGRGFHRPGPGYGPHHPMPSHAWQARNYPRWGWR